MYDSYKRKINIYDSIMKEGSIKIRGRFWNDYLKNKTKETGRKITGHWGNSKLKEDEKECYDSSKASNMVRIIVW